jgi:hypothetical protein
MVDETQASAETVNTDSTADSEKTSPVTETVDAVKHKQLLDSHAQLGRDLKAAREAASKAEARAAEVEAERERVRYEHEMNDDEKAEYRKRKEYEKTEAPKTRNLANERNLLKIIAETDDPKITKALSRLYYSSEERGRFPDKEDVLAFVDGLTPDDEEVTKVEPVQEKEPPKVTAVGGTRAITVSIDDEVKLAEASVKAKDGKFSYGELLGLRARRDAQKAAVSKG